MTEDQIETLHDFIDLIRCDEALADIRDHYKIEILFAMCAHSEFITDGLEKLIEQDNI